MTLQRVEEWRCDNNAEEARKKGAGRRGDACECLRTMFGPIPVGWGRKGNSADSEKEEDTNPILSTAGGIITTTDGSVATMGR